jgi:hypothetical protein
MIRLKKFFNTYGYLIIKNCLQDVDYEKLIGEYDSIFVEKYGFFPNQSTAITLGIEKTSYLHSIIENSQLIPLCKMIGGEDCSYVGSDLSLFYNPSQLHRDIWSYTMVFKTGIYLQDANESKGGKFLLIPGSHRREQDFANLCSNGLRWPSGSGYSDEILSVLDMKGGLPGASAFLDLPVKEISINKGDVLIFDQRLVHGTTHNPNQPRRMCALNFIEGFSSLKEKFTSATTQSYAEEIASVKVAENFIERPRFPELTLEYALGYEFKLKNSQLEQMRLKINPDLLEKYRSIINSKPFAFEYLMGNLSPINPLYNKFV